MLTGIAKVQQVRFLLEELLARRDSYNRGKCSVDSEAHNKKKMNDKIIIHYFPPFPPVQCCFSNVDLPRFSIMMISQH